MAEERIEKVVEFIEGVRFKFNGNFKNIGVEKIEPEQNEELPESTNGFKPNRWVLKFRLYQIDDPKRGFSYMNSGDLDMRMNDEDELSAYIVVNNYTEEQLKEIFYKYGEEKKARYIARNICNERESPS